MLVKTANGNYSTFYKAFYTEEYNLLLQYANQMIKVLDNDKCTVYEARRYKLVITNQLGKVVGTTISLPMVSALQMREELLAADEDNKIKTIHMLPV